jgi:hypothetical protein
MKSVLLMISIMTSVFTFAQNLPEIQWDDKGASQFVTDAGVVVECTIDYGSIKKGDESAADAAFGFKNIGGSSLIISDCHPSYNYTMVTAPANPIQPGENGVINLHYDIYRVGEFIIYVYLQSNAINDNGYQVIAIYGTVIE